MEADPGHWFGTHLLSDNPFKLSNKFGMGAVKSLERSGQVG